MYWSFVVGNVRIRQLRVQSTTCLASYGKLLKLSLIPPTTCFPPWSDGLQDTEYRSGVNGTIPPGPPPFFAQYLSAEQSQTDAVTGRFATYPGGGFVVDVAAGNASRTAAALAAARWLDARTRAVVVSFVLYSPDADMVGIVDLLFEVRGAGCRRATAATFPDALRRGRVAGKGYGDGRICYPSPQLSESCIIQYPTHPSPLSESSNRVETIRRPPGAGAAASRRSVRPCEAAEALLGPSPVRPSLARLGRRTRPRPPAASAGPGPDCNS